MRKPKRRRWRPLMLMMIASLWQLPHLLLVIVPCFSGSLIFFPLSAGRQLPTATNTALPVMVMNITRHQHGKYTPFYGGHDIDGHELFICRTHKFGQTIPGKYSDAIGKCSVAYHRREMQFNQFELLVESSDTRYEWVKLKKPVIQLPENVLLGGSYLPNGGENIYLGFLGATNRNRTMSRAQYRRSRHRFRRQIESNSEEWSRNWRGVMSPTFRKRPRAAIKDPLAEFTEIPLRCLEWPETCHDERQKLNYFIARCSLRTGNQISEQIGKIIWNQHEWIASFPFGGHEIYCLDYSVLTLKKKATA